MTRNLRWDRDSGAWPNTQYSRFEQAGGLRWHVQVAGSGPAVLLLHGTGATTHSWGGLLPLLAERFRIIAPDLPGHGFTGTTTPYRMSLPGMSHALAALLRHLEAAPALGIGHSAGAAILARMCLDDMLAPRAGLVSLNGAFLPFEGIAGRVFSPVAKVLSMTPVVPHIFARQARDPAAVDRLLNETGSTLTPDLAAHYHRLARAPGHVAAALSMMANWDLHSLRRDLPRLRPPVTLIVGETDRTVPPRDAERVQALVPAAQVIRLPGLGHLAHEENPDRIAALVNDVCREYGAVSDA